MKHLPRSFAMILATLFGVLFGALPQAGQAETRTLIHDGVERRFHIELPAGSGPAPTLIVLHGNGGSGRSMQRLAGFGLAAQGWVEIYPDGTGRSWNDGRIGLSGQPLRRADDMGFMVAMIGALVAEGRVDPALIYIAGLSNGGAMAQRMLCERPDLVAGIAVAIMQYPVGVTCPAGPAKPVLFLLGEADPLIPFGGGPVTLGNVDRGLVLSAKRTLEIFAARNACGAARETLLRDRDPQDGTRVTLRRFEGCETPLHAYLIAGGGHTWPGTRPRPVMRRILGTTSQDIDGTAVVEGFFLSLDPP